MKTPHATLLWFLLPLALVQGAVVQGNWTDTSPHKTGFITVNGVRLHYLDWGGAGETLLFLHGMGDTAHIYDELAPKFTNQFRVLGLTRRGHGESEIPETGYDTATLVEDIRQFLDALKIQRVILAGHSFAGDELTRFAVVHPDRVIKLIYFDSAYDHSRVPESLRFKPLHGGGPELFPTKEESESPDGLRRWIGRLFGEKRGRAIYSMMEGTYSAAAEYGKIKAPALAFFAIGYQKDVDRAETLPEPQRKNALEFLKAQRKYHEREIEHFRKGIPSARVVVLTNATHACFIDREDEVVREMQAFLVSTNHDGTKASFPSRVDLDVPVAPTPVKADSKIYLVYELHLTNFGTNSLESGRVEIFGDGTNAPPLASYEKGTAHARLDPFTAPALGRRTETKVRWRQSCQP
jgi:pimeloyl-ACP methyl ester carboxylesterase